MSERLATGRLLLKLAWRSLWRNRRRTQITLSSIAFGLWFAIFLGSISEGTYQKAIHDSTRLLTGQLTVETAAYNDNPGPALSLSGATALREQLLGLPGVARVRPLVVAQAVASSAAGAVGVGLLGIDAALEQSSSPLAEKLVAGKFLDPAEPRGLLVGAGLAKRLRVEPGKKVVITSTDVQGNVSSELFRVTGVFRLGSDELDTYVVQAHLPLVRKLLGLGVEQVGQLGIFVQPGPGVEQQVAAAARALLPSGLVVRTWQETLPALAAWISLDRKTSTITRAIILFLVMFTILNTLLMSVLERGHEFAVLLAIGTPRASLRAQVLLEVTLLSLLGCGLGALLGTLSATWGKVHGLDFSAMLPDGATAGGMALDPVIRCAVEWPSILGVTLFVFLTTIALGLWPMRRAGRVELAASLRTQR